MKGHLARRGGIWWARLVVPVRLRQAAGRREFTRSTRTHDLDVAKLVAASFVADWRRHLLQLDCRRMSSPVLKLLQAAPSLEIGTTVSLKEAEEVGVDRGTLLRVIEAGRADLYCRLGAEAGYLVDSADLDYDGATGGVDIPPTRLLPQSALECVRRGVLPFPDSRQIAASILAENLQDLRVIALRGDRSSQLFVPTGSLVVRVTDLEVSARAVQALRHHLSERITPAQVEQALAEQANASRPTPQLERAGGRSRVSFSQAVEAYCSDARGLPHDLASKAEQRQRRKGLLLFSDFMGDMELQDIDADKLRAFRDGPLRLLPARANNLPKHLKRDSMKATIAAIEEAGVDWPSLSEEMCQERMQWLSRLFRWLHQKEWLAKNPALPLDGETGLSKAERKERRRADRASDDDDAREPFTDDELAAIFSQSWFASGSGVHIGKPRFWYPFEYWLPLLGAFAGLRIGEACQLHLADIREVEGIWILDVNEDTPDKSLKNEQSRRQVPIHPRLVELGFLEYCARLKGEGFRRVFPELTWAKTDARYAKEPIRKMSQMLANLAMPRNGQRVFHCLRHNMNNALARVPVSALPCADENLRKFIRYGLMGHQVGDDVNVRHYTSTTLAEKHALIAGVAYQLPPVGRSTLTSRSARYDLL